MNGTGFEPAILGFFSYELISVGLATSFSATIQHKYIDYFYKYQIISINYLLSFHFFYFLYKNVDLLWNEKEDALTMHSVVTIGIALAPINIGEAIAIADVENITT